MKNLNALRNAFATALGIDRGEIVDDLSYGDKPWDSVAHMAIILEIEKAFDIMMETEDVINLSNYGKAQEILGKYGVNFES